MSNKQMTAVELLVNQFEAIVFYSEEAKEDVINQAKELEKQQIIDAWENGYEHGACVNEDEAKYHGIQYYNETYEQ